MTGEFHTDEKLFFPGVQPVTRNLLEAVFYDAPLSQAVIREFGLETWEHYGLLYYAIQVTDVHPMEIDAMAGDGAKLTAWLNDTGYNRQGLVFYTKRDRVEERHGPKVPPIEQTVPAEPTQRPKRRQRDIEQEL